MDRRRFLLGTLAAGVATPRGAAAQTRRTPYRIGMLEVVPAGSNAVNLTAFRRGLKELGYVEGEHFVLEYRSADGVAERFPGLAGELVRLGVDVIVTRGTPAALAAKQATDRIPIVMASSGDPLGTGLAASLAHPGRNVTGLSALANELQGKQLEMLKQMVPTLSRVAYLFNMSNPVLQAQWKQAEPVARSVGLQPRLLDVRTAQDLEPALDAAARQRASGVVVGIDALTQANRRQIIDTLARHRLPAISREREFADAGGLMSYGIHYADLYRRAAVFVDKIFKGANPGDLPIEQPITLEFVINVKTARALRLNVPAAVRARADQVID